ncbi:MAG: hypothetical protein HY327_11455 [Chloroflexi bacterium]|nr:hypothetical protein [Chloroflexota bacterium]
MLEFFRFSAAFIFLILPGFALAWHWLRDIDARARFILASASGVAFAIFAGFVLTYIHVVVAVAVLATGAVVASIYFLAQWKNRKAVFDSTRAKENFWLIAIVAGAGLVRLYPLTCSAYPSGSDSVFHLILANKILLTGHLPVDWTPFENIVVNYTTGAHLLVAMVSQLAGIPLHRAFALTMVALACVSTALIYVIAKAIFQRESVALWSAFAYAFTANLGSLDYYRWGGLPNEAGMTLLLTGFAFLFAAKNRAALVFAALAWAGIYLSHHHTILVLASIVGAMTLAQWLFKPPGETRRIWIALIGSALLASFWLVPYILRAPTIGNTLLGGFWFYMIRPWEIPTELGAMFTLLAIPGILALTREWSRTRDARLTMWGAWTAVLIGIFFFLEYGYRLITKILTGTALTVFTPDNFLTDAVYPLALAAGWTLERAARFLQTRFATRGRFFVGIGAAALAIGVAGMQMQSQCWVVVKPDEMAMYQWINANTPANAMILENPTWLEYITWREGSLTPLPVTEPVNDPSVVFKQEVLSKRQWDEIARWQAQTGRATFLVTQNEELNQPGWSRVFAQGQWRVYQSVQP